jgi:hypothetical protein
LAQAFKLKQYLISLKCSTSVADYTLHSCNDAPSTLIFAGCIERGRTIS